jgi:hypothetical protein
MMEVEHYVEVSVELYTPATLPLQKEPIISYQPVA